MTDFAPFDNTAALYRAGQVKIDSASLSLKNSLATTKLDAKTLGKIDKASKDFEANFMAEMMKPMFAGIKVDENFGGGKGEEVFHDFLVQEYGKKMAERGDLGIATMVRDQLIRQQEATIK